MTTPAAAALLGPTGNLRAPPCAAVSTLLVGFGDEAYGNRLRPASDPRRQTSPLRTSPMCERRARGRHAKLAPTPARRPCGNVLPALRWSVGLVADHSRCGATGSRYFHLAAVDAALFAAVQTYHTPGVRSMAYQPSALWRVWRRTCWRAGTTHTTS